MDYDDLKRAARRARFELAHLGVIDLGRPKVRRKPRDHEKRGAIIQMALERIRKYKPYYGPEGRLILPWYWDYFARRFPEFYTSHKRTRGGT